MGFSNMMMAAARSMPKSTMTQSMPSLTYSSCSTTNMWWLKNCCSFSLTKLMEICSKPLYSKISKPAMSSTAQKLAFFREAQGPCQRHCCRDYEVDFHVCSAAPSVGRPPRTANHCSQGGGQEEEEGWRQDRLLGLPRVPRGPDGDPVLLRAALRALPRA